jgi:hypothetical protein
MGYPGINKHAHILSKCVGTFLRHHTVDKSMTKQSTDEATLQAMTDLTHKMLHENKEKYWIKEEEEENKRNAKAERMGGNEPVISGKLESTRR